MIAFAETPTAPAHRTTRYVDVADCAKLIRKALKSAFPSTKFSVRSRRYSGGASIDVRWKDGPTIPRVEAIAKEFQGATFDASIDLMEYHTSTDADGEPVRYGADFVFCEREMSDEHWMQVARAVAEHWGIECPATRADSVWFWLPQMGLYFSDLIYRAAHDRTNVD